MKQIRRWRACAGICIFGCLFTLPLSSTRTETKKTNSERNKKFKMCIINYLHGNRLKVTCVCALCAVRFCRVIFFDKSFNKWLVFFVLFFPMCFCYSNELIEKNLIKKLLRDWDSISKWNHRKFLCENFAFESIFLSSCCCSRFHLIISQMFAANDVNQFFHVVVVVGNFRHLIEFKFMYLENEILFV